MEASAVLRTKVVENKVESDGSIGNRVLGAVRIDLLVLELGYHDVPVICDIVGLLYYGRSRAEQGEESEERKI